MKEMVRHCLPSEYRGDDSWFHRLNTFEQQETRRQVAFKRIHWPELEDGFWSKRPSYQYPHILPENHMAKALYDPVAAQILKYIKDEDVALHTEALNLRSSQVCCFNVLSPLREDKELGRLVLKPLLPNVRAVDAIEFEYTGPYTTTEWLGEPPTGERGQNRTSIDATIWWKDSVENKCVTLVEWKYTERSFGSCGGYESDANTTKRQCRVLDASAKHPETKCFLAYSNPPRRYWEHLAEAGIDRTKFEGFVGCPFRGPFYQLLRQSLLAAYLRHSHAADKVEVAVVSFDGNTSLLMCPPWLKSLVPGGTKSTILDAWNAVTPAIPPVRHVTIQQIMEAVDLTLPQGHGWRLYIRERYGV